MKNKSTLRALLISFLVTVCTGAVSYADENAEPIIDMHLHCYDSDSYFVAPDQYGQMAPATSDDHFKETYEMLRKYNVVKGVISGSLESVDQWSERDEDHRLVRGLMVNDPLAIDPATFEQLIIDKKIEIYGEIGAVYNGLTLNDPIYAPYLELCEKYDIPVAIHTGGGAPNVHARCCPDFRLSKGDPFTVEDILVEYPNLRVYLMHAGEVYYEKALRMMAQYSHVYVDLGVLLWIHPMTQSYATEFLEKAKLFGLLDRVMFGSDQMVWPHGIELSIQYLNEMEFLSSQDKRDILYNNAARFLRLP